MRTVFLVTRHPDMARIAPALERAGLAGKVVTPEQLESDDLPAKSGVVVLDLRDIPAATFDAMGMKVHLCGTEHGLD